MSTQVRFWVDPICPWCWVTARWIVEVAPKRDLEIAWEPISLFVKNEPGPDNSSYERLSWTYSLLRVMESVRAGEDGAKVGELYFEYGRRIHHDGERLWDPLVALDAIGVDRAHASAATDERWDAPLRERMDAGLNLVGDQVGTPIISIVGDDGKEVAAFGPVITKVPALEDSLALWDAFVTVIKLEEFWEIKRTRTRRPDVGARP